MSNISLHRIANLLDRCVRDFRLDLQNLTVFTEAATGPYLYTPILAALAGAKTVYAVTSNSRFGTVEHVSALTHATAQKFGVSKQIEVVGKKTIEAVAASDIITNSGFVRPINREMISWMKPTAVVPLMWEPWEFRESDLDLQACMERGILVLGTDESRRPHAMYPYGGFIAMKLLFELGLEGYKTRTILLGGGFGLGRSISDHFSRLGMEFAWFANTEEEAARYDTLADFFSAHGVAYDALIVAEHGDDTMLLGSRGSLTLAAIKAVNPGIGIGVISGNVDIAELRASGLNYWPRTLLPYRYMSFQAADLGPLPVLELYTAGLKVGEAMARARLNGMSVEDAKHYATANSPAVDFS